MYEIEFDYINLTPTEYYLKLNNVVCWLIESKISFEMLYLCEADYSFSGVKVYNAEDVTLVRLKFGL